MYLVSGRTLTQLFDRLADKLYVLTGTALHVGRHEILSIINKLETSYVRVLHREKNIEGGYLVSTTQNTGTADKLTVTTLHVGRD